MNEFLTNNVLLFHLVPYMGVWTMLSDQDYQSGIDMCSHGDWVLFIVI